MFSTLAYDSPHVRGSKTVSDSGLHAVDSGIQLTVAVDLTFWIPVVSGIMDSLSCIPDSTSKIFAEKKYWISQAKNFRILEIRFPYIGEI